MQVTTHELETSRHEAAQVQSAAQEYQELRKQLEKMSQALDRSRVEVTQAQTVKAEHQLQLEVTNQELQVSRCAPLV